MFNFEDASLHIGMPEIFKYVTPLQIFERYCSNYSTLEAKFNSEFYNDKNPACKIIISGGGVPYYKDFGNGDYFTCFEYVSKKYGSNYHETCNIIANDFGLRKSNFSVSPQLILANDIPKPIKIKSNIQVVIKPFSITDYNYWDQYGISLLTLQFFNVKACSHVYLRKSDKHYIFEYKDSTPLYSYKFFKNDAEYLKVYSPNSPTKEGKWLSNVGSDCLQGYDQLPKTGELLFITKSMKDVLCLYEMGYSAVGLQAETNKLSKKSYTELSKRFKRIILLLDNDDQGRTSTGDFILEYDIEFFFVDKAKDISDYTKEFGLKESHKFIQKNIK